MNFYHGPFEAAFNIDSGQINRDTFYRIFGGTNAGPFYDAAYENDPNIIDSTATEIIEEEEIKEQYD